MANNNFDKKNYEIALKNYNEILKLGIVNFDIFHNKWKTLAALNKYQEAIINYNLWIKINNKNNLIYKDRWDSYKLNWNYKEANKDYLKALNLNWSWFEIYKKLGEINYLLKKYEVSIQYYEIYLNSETKDIEALSGLLNSYKKAWNKKKSLIIEKKIKNLSKKNK